MRIKKDSVEDHEIDDFLKKQFQDTSVCGCKNVMRTDLVLDAFRVRPLDVLDVQAFPSLHLPIHMDLTS